MAKKKSKPNIFLSKSNKRNKIEELKRQYLEQQKINQIPSKEQFSKDDLTYGISQIEVLFNEANNRISKIKEQGFTSYAIEKVEAEGGKDYFDIEDIVDRESLLEQTYRVHIFLNDKGSTVDGALLDTALINAEIYKGKFGNQYNNEEYDYARFDNKTIDPDIAKRAFASYRRLEESRAGQIVGEAGYGSENLINVLYDAEIRGYDSLVYGTDILDTFYKEHKDQWDIVRQDTDNITAISGKIYDNIKSRYTF